MHVNINCGKAFRFSFDRSRKRCAGAATHVELSVELQIGRTIVLSIATARECSARSGAVMPVAALARWVVGAAVLYGLFTGNFEKLGRIADLGGVIQSAANKVVRAGR